MAARSRPAGKVFKEWVQIDSLEEEELRDLVRESIEFVTS